MVCAPICCPNSCFLALPASMYDRSRPVGPAVSAAHDLDSIQTLTKPLAGKRISHVAHGDLAQPPLWELLLAWGWQHVLPLYILELQWPMVRHLPKLLQQLLKQCAFWRRPRNGSPGPWPPSHHICPACVRSGFQRKPIYRTESTAKSNKNQKDKPPKNSRNGLEALRLRPRLKISSMGRLDGAPQFVSQAETQDMTKAAEKRGNIRQWFQWQDSLHPSLQVICRCIHLILT